MEIKVRQRSVHHLGRVSFIPKVQLTQAYLIRFIFLRRCFWVSLYAESYSRVVTEKKQKR